MDKMHANTRGYCNFACILFVVVVNGMKTTHSDLHHHMTKRELRHIFDVDHAKEVPQYELFDTNHMKWTDTRVKFNVFNEELDILLSPHDALLSPDLITVIRNGTNSKIHHGLHVNSECHYKGIALSHENASVAFSNCTFLRGTIALSDHFLVIHSMPSRFNDKHVIYKRRPSLAPNGESMGVNRRVKRASTDAFQIDTTFIRVNDQSMHEEFCDVKNLDNDTLRFLALRDEDSGLGFGGYGPLTLELALFMDAQLYQHFLEEFGNERAEQELVHFALALINNVYLLYQQPSMQPKLNVVIVRFELWKTQPEDIEGPKHKNGEAQLFLDAFCTYQAQMNPGNRALKTGRWDHATLLTGFDIYHTTSSVAGVAPVARMCDQVFSCSLVEGLHLGRSFVLAHEMGHNLGMVHDGVQNQCSRSCCLMSAVNGAGKTTWSPCSVRELNAYILSLGSPGAASNCLADDNHALEAKDHKLKGLLPGQRFTSDQQCSFFWGRDFRNEVPAGKAKSEICNILWCGNGGSTISTSHPALEGTFCGANKWCSNGQCLPWSSESIPPKPVDGSWSDWTSAARSQCSECKIANGIRVRKDLRGCDDPAPNNGGQDCKGSPIRGIVCTADEKPKCGDIDKQQFADDNCNALKDDGTGKGDTELSGKSFLHATSPCKIWCHLGDTKLIRNKGFFPDGTPCGIEKYCVDGECLELNCDRKALVFDNADCPKSISRGWSDWSSWASCSVTCGKGNRSRKRQCNGDISSCTGTSIDQEDCTSSECPTWTQWSVWAECSVTCGQGVRVRSRNCKNGPDCDGDSVQFEQCNTTACISSSWSEWTAWSVCTKTCGSDGQRSRRRTCQGERCLGESQDTESCPKRDCSEALAGLFTWSAWTSCSVTCGPGHQSRSRPCPYNNNPSILLEHHCTDGIMQEERECTDHACPSDQQNQWSDWTPFSPCTVTCGFGRQTRIRVCKTSNCGAGDDHDWKSCFAGVCPRIDSTQSPVWSSTISSTETNEVRANIVGWSQWANWSSCSRTCGGGFRQRYCLSHALCPPSGSIQIDNCNIQQCDAVWSSWSIWSQCSRTCGSDGQRTRTRRCLSSDECSGVDKEATQCDSPLAPCSVPRLALIQKTQSPEWSSWSSWSACSCFNDKSLRRRYCRILQPTVLGFCVGPVLDERPCNPNNCTPVPGGWSSWSEWSACSAECASGSVSNEGVYKIRHRQCSDPFPVNRGPYCFGQSFEKVPCSSLPSCSGSSVDGGWSSWSEWSECSTSCEVGHRSRTRFCTNPAPSNGGRPCQGLDFNLEVCQPAGNCPSVVDGAWGEWSSWSSCSQTCGFAFQSRQRICDSPHPSASSSCLGLSYMTKLCTLSQCPNAVNGSWSNWGAWSECNQCGYGVSARTRNCNNPHPVNGGMPCLGASTDVVLCTGQKGNCHPMDAHFEALENLIRKWEIS